MKKVKHFKYIYVPQVTPIEVQAMCVTVASDADKEAQALSTLLNRAVRLDHCGGIRMFNPKG